MKTAAARGVRGRSAAMVAGAVAAGLALAISVLVDALSTRVPSLISAVAQLVVRRTPGRAARLAIETVGQADKPLLRLGTVVLALVVGAVAGAFAVRRRWVGDLIFAVFGLL